jgi:hypothetical protein
MSLWRGKNPFKGKFALNDFLKLFLLFKHLLSRIRFIALSRSPTMCHAITKSGNVCKIKTKNYFCHLHTPDPLIEEQREEIIQKLLQPDITGFNFFDYQRQAWPLFKDIDLTAETLDIIRRAKDLGNWSDETYNIVISTYLDDSINNDVKYATVKQKINEYTSLKGKKDILTVIKTLDLYKDLNFLILKYTLSRGTYWDGLKDVRYVHTHIVPEREKFVNKYREDNLNNLRVNITKKHTPICDDVCNYIISKYL